MIEQFKTVKSISTGEFKDRGSKFIAYCYPFQNVNKLKEILLEVRKKHPKASHYCFAYRVGFEGNNFRYNDDGEPSGTAGRPILGAIDRSELINLLIIVVRYFGGTKLGTSGLINAYRKSALEAIQNGNIIEEQVMARWEITSNYEHSAALTNLLGNIGCKIINSQYLEEVTFLVEVKIASSEHFLVRIKAAIGRLHEEEILEETKIEGLRIKQIS